MFCLSTQKIIIELKIFFRIIGLKTPVFTEAKTNVLAVYSSEFATFKEKAHSYGTQAELLEELPKGKLARGATGNENKHATLKD
jgi:hypothetical protein